jgi:hypothetical protein
MRKVFGLATALLGVLAMTAVAIAGEAGPSPSGQIQAFDVTHSPSKPSSKKKKVGTKVNIKITLRKTDGTKPSPTTATIVTLPKGMGLNYTKFPQCSQSALEKNGPKACPKGSKVGTGRIEADASPVLAKVGGTVTAFNGKSKTYLLYVVPEISSPLVIPGKLKGKNVLDFVVPLVPTLPGQPNATLTYFEVTTGGVYKAKKKIHGKKKKVKINYLENPTKCPPGGYPWKLEFGYENGETLIPTDNAPC